MNENDLWTHIVSVNNESDDVAGVGGQGAHS